MLDFPPVFSVAQSGFASLYQLIATTKLLTGINMWNIQLTKPPMLSDALRHSIARSNVVRCRFTESSAIDPRIFRAE